MRSRDDDLRAMIREQMGMGEPAGIAAYAPQDLNNMNSTKDREWQRQRLLEGDDLSQMAMDPELARKQQQEAEKKTAAKEEKSILRRLLGW